MAEVLSQSQIDALLSAAFSGDAAALPAEEPKQKYRKYDFYSPRKFTKDRLKMLSGVFDSYCRVLNSRINGLLHANCEVEVESVEEQRYYEFSNALTEGAVLAVANLTLKGKVEDTNALLYITEPLMVSMMDRMMGGEGEVDEDLPSGYVYTELDLHLYSVLMRNFVAVMGNSWENYIQLSFEYERVEVRPTLVQLIRFDETVVLVDLKVNFSNSEGRLSICLPGTMLTNIFQEISRESPGRRAMVENRSDEIFEHLRSSDLEIVAELGRASLQLQDIYHLNVGDVINLQQKKDSSVDLYIHGQRWFNGFMGAHNKNVAVKIEDIHYITDGRGSLQDEQ